jgi:hypothetical protein
MESTRSTRGGGGGIVDQEDVRPSSGGTITFCIGSSRCAQESSFLGTSQRTFDVVFRRELASAVCGRGGGGGRITVRWDGGIVLRNASSRNVLLSTGIELFLWGGGGGTTR